MTARKVMNARDINTGENIYFLSHAKATYMSDNRTVEDSINNKQDYIQIVNHGTADTTFELTPNVLHKWDSVSSLQLTLSTPFNTDVANYYMFLFVSGDPATSLTLPDTISWSNDVTIDANTTYQISILNNLGVIGAF